MGVHQRHGAERVLKADLPRASSQMNITPLIDVLLVLLVIFMAALPLSQRGVDVTLPPSEQEPRPVQPTTSVVVEMTEGRQLSINRHPTTSERLEADLREIFSERHDKTLFVMGAATLRYGDIVDVIDAAKGAGVERVGIVTEGMRRAAKSAGG